MKKLTKWKTKDGYTTVASLPTRSALLETGYKILLEDNGQLLLESSSVTPKKPTGWVN